MTLNDQNQGLSAEVFLFFFFFLPEFVVSRSFCLKLDRIWYWGLSCLTFTLASVDSGMIAGHVLDVSRREFSLGNGGC